MVKNIVIPKKRELDKQNNQQSGKIVGGGRLINRILLGVNTVTCRFKNYIKLICEDAKKAIDEAKT